MNAQQEKYPQARYLRFPLPRRIEHWVNGAAFLILALTGLPQKFFEASLSLGLINALGGIEAVRILHRVAAVVLALVALWHFGYNIYVWYVQRKNPSMLPNNQDGFNAWQTLKYNLGLEPERPQQGFYTFEEKMEYWALLWGTLVMVLSGFFLWNPITAARYFPGEWIPAAKAAHGGEALLAVLAILLWHMYHVLVRTFNKSMYTGYMSRAEMEHEHPLALHEPALPKLDPAKFQRRKRQFWIGYGVVATLWLVGVIWFVTSEQTATATIPEPPILEVFSPLTPTPFPTPGEIPEAALRYGTTWEANVGSIFITKCGDCHNPRNGEKNLDLSTYSGTLAGGDSGPAVVPGAPGISPALLWPTFEDHPGKLSPAETAAIQAWIRNGAAEK
jgi:cytochrome b subunit of formate dehydrogenase